MALATDLNNALALLYRGEWREIVCRMRIRRHGIDLENSRLDELGLHEDTCHEYANSGGAHLARVFRALRIMSEDSIVDFGSGKGGALITMARFPFARITGVEISSRLAAVARRNLDALSINNVTTRVADATCFTDLDGYNYFYFFSPFPHPVMSAVMKNICTSLQRQPRKAFIVYLNPEFHDAVVTDSPFVKVREFDHNELRYYIYANSP